MTQKVIIELDLYDIFEDLRGLGADAKSYELGYKAMFDKIMWYRQLSSDGKIRVKSK